MEFISSLSGSKIAFKMKQQKRRRVIPMVVMLVLFMDVVNSLASNKMMSKHKLTSRKHHYHPQPQDPLTSLSLPYAIDSTRIVDDVPAPARMTTMTMPQNMTIQLSVEEVPSIVAATTTTAETEATTTNNNATTTNSTMVMKAWQKIRNAMKFDRKAIAKLGVDFGLTYNMISNINGSFTLSTAWYIASMKTGLSPLAPGQWKSLLAAYASLYVVAALMRPIRIAVALGATHKMEHFLQYMQKRIGCTRPSAIGIVFSFGVVLWLSCCAAGVTLASTLAGVPLWKYSL